MPAVLSDLDALNTMNSNFCYFDDAGFQWQLGPHMAGGGWAWANFVAEGTLTIGHAEKSWTCSSGPSLLRQAESTVVDIPDATKRQNESLPRYCQYGPRLLCLSNDQNTWMSLGEAA